MVTLNPYLIEINCLLDQVLKLYDYNIKISNENSRIHYIQNAEERIINEISDSAKICLYGYCALNSENIVNLCKNFDNFIKISDKTLSVEERRSLLLANDPILMNFLVPTLSRAINLIKNRLTDIHKIFREQLK